MKECSSVVERWDEMVDEFEDLVPSWRVVCEHEHTHTHTIDE